MKFAHQFDRSVTGRPRSPNVGAGGFTIVELLIVVALIILLLSILLVAMSAATRSSKVANTQALMDSMKKSLVRFKGDIGYYPPVLGVAPPGPGGGGTPELRRLYAGSVPNPDATGGDYIDQMQEYYSTCTLADYLIGYGGHTEDGWGRVPGASNLFDWEMETPSLGIRPPGPDGVWGATTHGTADGGLANRMKGLTASGGWAYGSETAPYPIDQGKVFGPYLEMKDERLVAAVHYPAGGGGVETYFPGDTLPANPSGPPFTWESMPKAIVDYWGMPIRYYRRPYPPGALAQSYRAVNRDGTPGADRVPTLSDVYVLRPQSFKPGSEISNPYPDSAGSKSTTSQLDAAEFALLSTGADRRLNQDRTVDVEGYNIDNIVETGP